jgi:hypothetical protein
LVCLQFKMLGYSVRNLADVAEILIYRKCNHSMAPFFINNLKVYYFSWKKSFILYTVLNVAAVI